jgi:hypothetical protein
MGNLYRKWLKFWLSSEWNSNPPFLLDFYFDVQPIDEFGIRFGQQYTPFSRHESYGPQQILFPDWAVVADYFWSGRDKGGTILGWLFDKKVEYYLGMYAGSPLRVFTTYPGDYVLEARATVYPNGPIGEVEFPYIVAKDKAKSGWSFTINGYYGKTQPTIENFNPTSFKFVPEQSGVVTRRAVLGADIFFQGPFYVFTIEAYARRTMPTNGDPDFTTLGIWGQAGIMVVPKLADIGARISYVDASTDLSNDNLWILEAKTTYYIHAPFWVLHLRYGYADQQTPGTAALKAVSLPLAPGTYHVLTLQMNLAF